MALLPPVSRVSHPSRSGLPSCPTSTLSQPRPRWHDSRRPSIATFVNQRQRLAVRGRLPQRGCGSAPRPVRGATPDQPEIGGPARQTRSACPAGAVRGDDPHRCEDTPPHVVDAQGIPGAVHGARRGVGPRPGRCVGVAATPLHHAKQWGESRSVDSSAGTRDPVLKRISMRHDCTQSRGAQPTQIARVGGGNLRCAALLDPWTPPRRPRVARQHAHPRFRQCQIRCCWVWWIPAAAARQTMRGARPRGGGSSDSSHDVASAGGRLEAPRCRGIPSPPPRSRGDWGGPPSDPPGGGLGRGVGGVDPPLSPRGDGCGRGERRTADAARGGGAGAGDAPRRSF